MDPFDRAVAIVKQMMAMLDAHHESKDGGHAFQGKARG
jgi:hypothetical protein